MKFYYKCDETSGTRADSHTNGLDVAQVAPSTGSQAGALNLAVNATGNSANRLEAAHNDLFRGDSASGFTISAWCRLGVGEAALNNPLVAHWVASGNERGWLLWQRPSGGDNFLRFLVSSDGSATQEVAWNVDTTEEVWHHVLAWHDPDGDELGIIVDGGTPITTSYSLGINANTATFGIGQINAGGIMAVCGIDEIGGWDRLLTDPEKTVLYGSGTPPSFDTFGSGAATSEDNDILLYYIEAWRKKRYG
jgi:hypothetical protein